MTTTQTEKDTLKQVILRIDGLSGADRDDLLELARALHVNQDRDERDEIIEAMAEIIAGPSTVTSTPMTMLAELPLEGGLRKLAEHMGSKIRELRERAELTQAELADRAGLGQPHISRIEAGSMSPTHKTIKKIADALAVEVGEIDPCCE